MKLALGEDSKPEPSGDDCFRKPSFCLLLQGDHMTASAISEEMIFQCFAAARQAWDLAETVESFVDVEEYENRVMYPEFARWAEKAGQPQLATLFRKVAGEEKLHAVWLRSLYRDMGVPRRGEDTQRAIEALETIRANCDVLFDVGRECIVEKALKVAIMVEEREYSDIYPRFRDQALAEGDSRVAEVYQRVIDSERQHAEWFRSALSNLSQPVGATV